MKKSEDVPLNAALIGFGNNSISLIAGIIIFSTVFSFSSVDHLSLLADRFKLHSDPGRLAMIYALLEAGEMSVGDLAAAVEASESGTSHQLRLLRQGGLVRSRPEGRSVYYRVADMHIRLLLDVAVEHYLHGHGGDA